MRRFLPALLLTAAVTLAAPFMGLIRNALFDAFPKNAALGLTIVLGILAAGAFAVAVARIREHRGWRYAGLALVAVLLWVQAIGFETELADVNVVEKMHIVQYGLLAYLLYLAFGRATDPVVPLLVLLWTTVAGTFEEGVQWWVETRTGEIRDVLLNAFSGLCGLVFSLSLSPPRAFSWRVSAARWRSLGTAAAVTVLALGTFFYNAHLGHVIDDPEIGRFRSYFTRDELIEGSRRRAERWQEDPPRDLSPWKKEDLFLTEAGWHSQHRNASRDLELHDFARQANLILEKYYAPYLDLETFRRAGVRRLSPEMVRELDEKAPPSRPESYFSPVGEKRIYTWPSKPAFATLVALLAALAWALPRFLARR